VTNVVRSVSCIARKHEADHQMKRSLAVMGTLIATATVVAPLVRWSHGIGGGWHQRAGFFRHLQPTQSYDIDIVARRWLRW